MMIISEGASLLPCTEKFSESPLLFLAGNSLLTISFEISKQLKDLIVPSNIKNELISILISIGAAGHSGVAGGQYLRS